MLDNYTNYINQLEFVDQLPIPPTNTTVFFEDSSPTPVTTAFIQNVSLTENTIHIIFDPQTAFILDLLHDITFVILTLVLSKIIFWILNKLKKCRFWKETIKSYEQKAIESNDVQAVSSSNVYKKEGDESTDTAIGTEPSSSNALVAPIAEVVSTNVRFYIDEDDHWVPDDIVNDVNKIDNNRVNNIIVKSNSHANNSDVAAAEKMKFVIAGFERTLNRKHLFVFFCALLLYFFLKSNTCSTYIGFIINHVLYCISHVNLC